MEASATSETETKHLTNVSDWDGWEDSFDGFATIGFVLSPTAAHLDIDCECDRQMIITHRLGNLFQSVGVSFFHSMTMGRFPCWPSKCKLNYFNEHFRFGYSLQISTMSYSIVLAYSISMILLTRSVIYSQLFMRIYNVRLFNSNLKVNGNTRSEISTFNTDCWSLR